MLTAVAHQIIERVIEISIADDAIELSELMEDSEEEKEDELILFQSIEIADFEVNTELSFDTIPNTILQLDIYYKIPVPPPELANESRNSFF